MDLHHRFVVPASFDVAWDAFNDLEGLVPCVPGGELTAAEGDTFSGTVKVKLGPISMLYGGTGEFLERDKAAGRMVVKAKGKDKRGNGTAGATVVAQLTPEGTGTAVDVTTDLAVTGKPAQFGRGVIQDVSDKLLGQFVECISTKLGSVPTSAPTAAAGSVGDPDVADTERPGTEPLAQAHVADDMSTAAEEPTLHVAGGASATGKPNELNLLSTVMPVLVRRYALPVVIALVVIAGVWIWLAQ
ncbi:MAG TPA: SRPBCC family protein, partial [Terrimesophilobacter sp.]|nr:SRPBCC family protein [Terrimesophilobacter sp.]